MKTKFLIAVLFTFRILAVYCQATEVDPDKIKFTILYNDIVLNEFFIGDQGFSCLIEIEGKSYLFDASNIESILGYNTEALGVDCSKIEFIYFSHLHVDHICGLSGIIDACSVFAI